LRESPSALRVAYLADEYPRREETFIQREVAALRAQRVHVETFSLWESAIPESLRTLDQEPTFYLGSVRLAEVLRAHLDHITRRPIRYLQAMRLARHLAPPGTITLMAALQHFTGAVVLAGRLSERGLAHLHNHATGASCTVALIAAALGDTAFSFTVHGPGVFFAPLARRLDEKLSRAQFVRCVSHVGRAQCLLWTPPERWDRLHVVHCGVDPQTYHVRRHDGQGSHLLFVGRLAVEKGLPFLVEAFARLCAGRLALRLTIVGDGPERQATEARARSAGVAGRIQFTGYQTPEQVAAWLDTTDVFVLPSLAEGIPVVLMEAMASGVPVVATSVGGVSELVEDGVNGFLVPAAAPEILAQRIEALLDDPSLRCRFGREGRMKVTRDFNLADETARLRDLFEWAVPEDNGPARHGGEPGEVLHG
jgi:glycosyltransferase involved in cell wall biosynthesis